MASDAPVSNIIVYFDAYQKKSPMEVNPDPSDPLVIPKMAEAAQSCMFTWDNNYLKKSLNFKLLYTIDVITEITAAVPDTVYHIYLLCSY